MVVKELGEVEEKMLKEGFPKDEVKERKIRGKSPCMVWLRSLLRKEV